MAKIDYTFIWDANTNPVFVGDYVKCVHPGYSSIGFGERRRVQAIVEGKITLRNEMSPIGTSDYTARNFELCGRHHPAHKNMDLFFAVSEIHNQQEKSQMLHLAIRVPEGWVLGNIAASIVNWNSSDGPEGKPLTHPDNLLVDVSQSALKEKVRQAILRNPHERWLILSGNTIAETSAPPVVFRQW